MSLREEEARERFRREAVAFGLCWRCDHCVHQVSEDGACSLGYPNQMLRTPHLECRAPRGGWTFCKYFELEGT